MTSKCASCVVAHQNHPTLTCGVPLAAPMPRHVALALCIVATVLLAVAAPTQGDAAGLSPPVTSGVAPVADAHLRHTNPAAAEAVVEAAGGGIHTRSTSRLKQLAFLRSENKRLQSLVEQLQRSISEDSSDALLQRRQLADVEAAKAQAEKEAAASLAAAAQASADEAKAKLDAASQELRLAEQQHTNAVLESENLQKATALAATQARVAEEERRTAQAQAAQSKWQAEEARRLAELATAEASAREMEVKRLEAARQASVMSATQAQDEAAAARAVAEARQLAAQQAEAEAKKMDAERLVQQLQADKAKYEAEQVCNAQLHSTHTTAMGVVATCYAALYAPNIPSHAAAQCDNGDNAHSCGCARPKVLTRGGACACVSPCGCVRVARRPRLRARQSWQSWPLPQRLPSGRPCVKPRKPRQTRPLRKQAKQLPSRAGWKRNGVWRRPRL